MNIQIFITAFITLFVIVDPVGTAAVFAGLTQSKTRRQTQALAVRAVLIALAIYAVFGCFGPMIMTRMGLSLAAFKIAGGILLFVTAYRMVMGQHDNGDIKPSGQNSLAIFPLAIPMLAGPGCLTAFLLLLGSASAMQEITAVIAGLLAVQLLAFTAFVLAGELRRILGEGFMLVAARVMGILLASMAIQFIINGLKEALPL
jgi:multiple antibiotic resistance protein